MEFHENVEGRGVVRREQQLSLKQNSDKERKRQQDFIVVRAELSSRGDDPIRESSPRSDTVITW